MPLPSSRSFLAKVKHRLLFTFFFLLILLLPSCASAPEPAPVTPQLIFINLESSGAPQIVSQPDLRSPSTTLPFAVPANCSIYNLYPNPVQALLAMELLCGDQAQVIILDTQTGKPSIPVDDSDSRFLAWMPDGRQVYLRVDTLGNPRVIRFTIANGRSETLAFPPTLYDLVVLPGGKSVLYSTTHGIGSGSEVWLAAPDGRSARGVFTDSQNIVAYLRPSPDGNRVAFILFPDSQVPFPNGELWLMDVNGENPRKLASADAGHGYAPAWSPDGTQIVFVVRENASDRRVEQSAGALISNLYQVEVRSGTVVPVTRFTDAIVETPLWSPDGSAVAFNIIRNGKIQASVHEMGSTELTTLGNGLSCCAIWLPGK
jgi:Tol biopolymer transport system component